MNWNKSIDRSYCLTSIWFTSIYSVRAWSWPSCTHTASYLGIFHYRGFFLYFIKTRSWFIINIAITLFINMVLSIFTLYFSICQCIEIDEKRPLKMVKSNSSIECAETKINKWSFLYHFYDLYQNHTPTSVYWDASTCSSVESLLTCSFDWIGACSSSAPSPFPLPEHFCVWSFIKFLI